MCFMGSLGICLLVALGCIVLGGLDCLIVLLILLICGYLLLRAEVVLFGCLRLYGYLDCGVWVWVLVKLLFC